MRVLFVCLGNICRSPMAEGIFRQVAKGRQLEVEIDSAGTSNWHIGEPPDTRGQERLLQDGIDISGLRGRQVSGRDFTGFDIIIAMDDDNLMKLRRLAGTERAQKVQKFLDFVPGEKDGNVPDPYYGGSDGFELVLDMMEEGCREIIAHARNR